MGKDNGVFSSDIFVKPPHRSETIIPKEVLSKKEHCQSLIVTAVTLFLVFTVCALAVLFTAIDGKDEKILDVSKGELRGNALEEVEDWRGAGGKLLSALKTTESQGMKETQHFLTLRLVNLSFQKLSTRLPQQ